MTPPVPPIKTELEIEPKLGRLLTGDGQTSALIAELATAAASPHVVADGVVEQRLVPEGYKVEQIAFPEELLERPRRKTGSVTVHDAESFITYVERHRDADATTVWINEDSGQVVAVIDDHATEDADTGAGWGQHRCTLALRKTPEWQHWTSRDGQLTEQEAFAEHIDQGLLEIVQPDGATLLEIAQTFHATTNAEFRSSTRLQDGNVQFLYSEEADAKAGRSGQLEIPATFELQVAPFVGVDAQQISADLRYRLRGGKLVIGYRLRRPHEVIDKALTELRDRLAAADLVVLTGVPR